MLFQEYPYQNLLIRLNPFKLDVVIDLTYAFI